MMVQIWIFVYESSPQTRFSASSSHHHPRHLYFFVQISILALAVGRTSPRMESDAHLRITEIFFRSPPSEVERERERESEREGLVLVPVLEQVLVCCSRQHGVVVRAGVGVVCICAGVSGEEAGSRRRQQGVRAW